MASRHVERFRDAAPQRRLPFFVCLRGAVGKPDVMPPRPRVEPRRPVRDVVLDQGRGTRGEVIAHPLVGLRQVARQRRMRGNERRVAEDRVDPPREDLRRERRRFRHGHQRADLLPQPLRQERELHVGADAGAIGDRELHFAAYRRTRDNDLVRNERRGRYAVEPRQQRGLEDLVAVRQDDPQHCGCRRSECRRTGSDTQHSDRMLRI